MPAPSDSTIARLLAQHLGSEARIGFRSGTLVKVTPGTRGATVTAGTAPTETSHACKLAIGNYTDREVAGTSIRTGDHKISILGASIAGGVIPAPSDKVVVAGVTYRLVDEPGSPGVKGDAVGAMYRCHARA